MEYLSLGYVIGTHGLDGTLKLVSTSHFAHSRYTKVKKFYFLDKEGKRKLVTLLSFKINGELHYLKFQEITTLEIGQLFKGSVLQIEKSDAEIPQGYYLFSDLLDCLVYDEKDLLIGRVSKVEEFPAQITLRVKKEDGKEFFVPFIEQFIISVELDKKKITIKVIPGLL